MGGDYFDFIELSPDRVAFVLGEVFDDSIDEVSLEMPPEDIHHFVEAAGRNDDMTMVVIRMLSRT